MQTLPTQNLSVHKKSSSSIGLFMLCFFVAVALIIFLTYPKYSDWKTKKQQIASSQEALNQVQSEASTATSEISKVNNPNLAKAVIAVPNQTDIANLYASIESLSAAANVKLTSLQAIANTQESTAQTPSAPVDATGAPVVQPSIPVPNIPSSLGTVNVTLEATGDYTAVEQMISSIYHSLRIIDVQKITLTTDQGNGGTKVTVASPDPSIDLQLQLLTYYSK